MVTKEYRNKNLYRTKTCIGSYKKKLTKINKKRARANTKQLINNVFDDLEDFYYDYLVYGDPLRDMYGQLIDKTSEEYLLDEDPDWLEYLGREWSLDDELAYCDKVMYENSQPEEDYNFTDEEIEYAANSWNKANNKQELDPIQRAMNAFQAVKHWQESWRKYGVIGAVKLYFGIGNK